MPQSDDLDRAPKLTQAVSVNQTPEPGAWRGGYLPQLDGLRAVAILLVMVLHAQWVLWAKGDPQAFLTAITDKSPRNSWEIGWAGVDLFFVLSGYLITRILMELPKGAKLRIFYGRRVRRIPPLYAFTLLIAFGIGPWLPGVLQHNPEGLEFWRFATFTHNFSAQPFWSWLLTPSWSLGVEAHFYLVWPLIVLRCPRHHLGALFALIVLGLPTLKWVALQHIPLEGLIYHVSPFRFDDFAAGAWVAWAQLHPDRCSPQRLRRLSYLLSPLALVGLILLAWFDPVAPLLGVEKPLLAIGGFSLLALGFGGWVGLAVTGLPTGLHQLLTHPLIVWIGRISYGVYLLHMLGFMVVSVLLFQQGISSPWIQIPTMFLAAIILGAFSWYGLERPILQRKKDSG